MPMPSIGKYAVKLSNVGNPDFRQDPSRPLHDTECGWAIADTLQGCVEACRAYRIEYDLGGGNWNGGQIFDIAARKQIGRVSYNGRVWDMNDQPMDQI